MLYVPYESATVYSSVACSRIQSKVAASNSQENTAGRTGLTGFSPGCGMLHSTQISRSQESYLGMPAIGGVSMEDLLQRRRENIEAKKELYYRLFKNVF